MNNKNLFILCMNNSGSTILQEALSNCKKTVLMPRLPEGDSPDHWKAGISSATSSEGQVHAANYMPIPWKHNVGALWTEKKAVFKDYKNYDWDNIKKKWCKAWSGSDKYRDGGVVLLEKSPPNVIRAKMLQEVFDEAYFLIMVRNPYAVCEGMRRRYGKNLARSARHWCAASKEQVKNIKMLNNVEWFTYEQLCSKRNRVECKIKALMPELSDINLLKKVSGANSIDGKHLKNIINYNERQIKNLTRPDMRIINAELRYNADVMKYFGYGMRT